MPTAIVTGSGGLIGSESVRHFVEPGFDVVGLENDMRAQLLRPRGLDARTSRAACVASSDGFRSLDARHPRRATASMRVFARARARPRAHRPHRRAAVARLGGVRPADRLRRQRERHAEPARGRAPACARRDVHLHLDQQGLRRPAEPPAAASSSRPASNCPRTTAATAASTRRCRSTARTHSLFGVSKAAADLMVQEYGRYFDMPTVCFRGGCLTGPQHAGAQLHGFLAYLMKCTVTGEPYTVFGYGGKQVRDNIHAPTSSAPSTPSTPRRAPPPSTTSAAAVQQLLDARGDRRSARRSPAAARLAALRRGAHGRPPLVDQRPGRVRARLPGLAARRTASRRCCARSSSRTRSPGRAPPGACRPRERPDRTRQPSLKRARGR